ncbi:unnamed protein product [Laminaria digitata]
MNTDEVDDGRLAAMRDRLEKARVAVSQGEITPEHYREVDKAIYEALGQLSFLRRSGNSNNNKNNSNNNSNNDRLQWAKPLDRPQHVEDLASAHSQGIKRLQAMVEKHNGPLVNLMLEPSKRAELAGILQGAGDGQIRKLLSDMQGARDTMDKARANKARAIPRAAPSPIGLANPGTKRWGSSPMCKDMDNTPLLAIRDRLQDARAAVSRHNVTPQHYQQVDKAISGALGQLPFLRRSDQDGRPSNQIQWAKPPDRPQHAEDLASAHSQGIKRIQAMVEEHDGPLEELMLEPSKRAELAAIFEGAGDGQLRKLLSDMQRAKETADSHEKKEAPENSTTARGLPLPKVPSCREVTRPLWFRTRDLKYLLLPGGKKISLLRPVAKAFYGDVFHGICVPPTNLPAFRQRQRKANVAIKKSSLEAMRHCSDRDGFREVSVMQILSEGAGHEHVMPLVEAVVSETHLYLVTPLHGRGNLLQNIDNGLGIGEHLARRWFQQILLGIGHIHGKGICHRNFDAENVAITVDGRATVVMDFGMAQLMPTGPGGEVVLTRDESVLSDIRYMAPEVYRRQPYDGRQADIWAVGVTFFVCMFGRYPWRAPITTLVRAMAERVRSANSALIQVKRMRFSEYTDYGVSMKVMDLIRAMLVVDRARRPCSADNLAHHHFFAG